MFSIRRDPQQEFWRWLVKHRRQILEDTQSSRPLDERRWSIFELGRRLEAVDAGLVHEIGMSDPSTIELIVSADGMKETFPAVIALVRSAPSMVGFKITAFRPRCPDGVSLEVDGITVTDDLLTYRLVPEGDTLGLELFIDGELDQKARTLVGFLSLDRLLGEYDVATGLTWIDFAGGRPSDAAPIAGLARDFDSRRGVVTH